METTNLGFFQSNFENKIEQFIQQHPGDWNKIQEFIQIQPFGPIKKKQMIICLASRQD